MRTLEITWTNALQNRCYVCIHWSRVIYSVVIVWQSNPSISQFNSPCNEFTSVWPMFVYKTSLYISANHVTTTHKPIARKYNITLSSPTVDITTNEACNLWMLVLL